MKETTRKHNPLRVALAYSGGLDTSVMIPWLRENYGCEVVAVVANVGQREDFDAIRTKALETGAVECVVLDLQQAFVEESILPALRAGAVYEGRYLLGTALARPIIARAQVEAALEHECDAVAHGCTGKGNDQVRFELAYAALAPELRVLAPWRGWEIASREDAIDYAAARGIPVPVTRAKPYSIDRNLWHTSFEGGVLENPWASPPEGLHDLTVPIEDAPDAAEEVEIQFRHGIPVGLNGKPMESVHLLERLNDMAGAHGIGRVDLVENRLVGMKSRGVYETPAGTVLYAALKDLEAITLDRDVMAFKRTAAARYAELIYQGLWFSPLREALDDFFASTHRVVTGRVRVKLLKGNAMPVGRTSPYSLYSEDLATFEGDDVYDQADAGGFIRLWGLQTAANARARRTGAALEEIESRRTEGPGDTSLNGARAAVELAPPASPGRHHGVSR